MNIIAQLSDTEVQLNEAQIDVETHSSQRDTLVEKFLDSLDETTIQRLKDREGNDRHVVIPLGDGTALVIDDLAYDDDAHGPDESGWYWDTLTVAPVLN